MKALFYLLAGFALTSFSARNDDDNIDGIWMGYYRSNITKEKVIIKFDSEDRMEFYTGGVDDRARCKGSYRQSGDSVSFTYTSPEGQVFTMQGRLNYRRNYVDGNWKSADQTTGKFYLEKQKVEERFAFRADDRTARPSSPATASAR